VIDIENNNPIFEIEPMLLIPLVYGALIFSDIREDAGFIKIVITNIENKFCFSTQYSHSKNVEFISFDFNSTLILENIKKRLSLKYGNNANILYDKKEYLSAYIITIIK